ncbi:MAG: hypothetical protein GKR98_16015 [Boseongicola sp.]|nr:MAG: hypothetical protein GKR98_16015 [Boseongicola sp.]
MIGPTEVTVTFEAEGAQTRVRVVHVEGDAELGDQWDSRVALFSGGWNAALPALAAFVEDD